MTNTIKHGAITSIVLLFLAFLTGCTETPQEPIWSNPFDPGGTLGGDPFSVQANYSGHQVIVTWNVPAVPGITSFLVERASAATGPFTTIATLEPIFSSYSDTEYVPDQANYYRVRATNASAETSPSSSVIAAEVMVPPDITIGETATIARRQVDITVRSSRGESIEIDDTSAFPAPLSAEIVDGVAVVMWDVGLATANNEWKHIYVRIFFSGIPGAAHHDSIQVDFSPDLSFEGNPETLASRSTPLVMIGGSGIEAMRFAADREILSSADWLDGADTHDSYELTALPDSQLVYGEFTSDLGISWIDSVWAVPDDLSPLELVLNGGSATTAGDDFLVDFVAVATDMRLASTPEDLATTAWQPYDLPMTWAHDRCDSGVAKTVYVQVRNDWFEPNALSGSVIWLPSEALGLTYTGPGLVTSGETVELVGTAIGNTCGSPLASVEIDTGTGYVVADGTLSWSFDWTVPTVSEITTHTIAWRVSDGATEDTGTFNVVINP